MSLLDTYAIRIAKHLNISLEGWWEDLFKDFFEDKQDSGDVDVWEEPRLPDTIGVASTSWTELLSRSDTDMKPYMNYNGKSGVVEYDTGVDWFLVRFRDSSLYLYTEKSTAAEHIYQMRRLAETGSGLNSYLNRVVGKQYAGRNYKGVIAMAQGMESYQSKRALRALQLIIAHKNTFMQETISQEGIGELFTRLKNYVQGKDEHGIKGDEKKPGTKIKAEHWWAPEYKKEIDQVRDAIKRYYLNPTWLDKQKFVTGTVDGKGIAGPLNFDGRLGDDPLSNIPKGLQWTYAREKQWVTILNQYDKQLRTIDERVKKATTGSNNTDEKAHALVINAMKEMRALPKPKLPKDNTCGLGNRNLTLDKDGDVQTAVVKPLQTTNALKALTKEQVVEAAKLLLKLLDHEDVYDRIKGPSWLDHSDGDDFNDWLNDNHESDYMEYYDFDHHAMNQTYMDGVFDLLDEPGLLAAIEKWIDRSIVSNVSNETIGITAHKNVLERTSPLNLRKKNIAMSVKNTISNEGSDINYFDNLWPENTTVSVEAITKEDIQKWYKMLLDILRKNIGNFIRRLTDKSETNKKLIESVKQNSRKPLKETFNVKLSSVVAGTCLRNGVPDEGEFTSKITPLWKVITDIGSALDKATTYKTLADFGEGTKNLYQHLVKERQKMREILESYYEDGGAEIEVNEDGLSTFGSIANNLSKLALRQDFGDRLEDTYNRVKKIGNFNDVDQELDKNTKAEFAALMDKTVKQIYDIGNTWNHFVNIVINSLDHIVKKAVGVGEEPSTEAFDKLVANAGRDGLTPQAQAALAISLELFKPPQSEVVSNEGIWGAVRYIFGGNYEDVPKINVAYDEATEAVERTYGNPAWVSKRRLAKGKVKLKLSSRVGTDGPEAVFEEVRKNNAKSLATNTEIIKKEIEYLSKVAKAVMSGDPEKCKAINDMFENNFKGQFEKAPKMDFGQAGEVEALDASGIAKASEVFEQAMKYRLQTDALFTSGFFKNFYTENAERPRFGNGGTVTSKANGEVKELAIHLGTRLNMLEEAYYDNVMDGWSNVDAVVRGTLALMEASAG